MHPNFTPDLISYADFISCIEDYPHRVPEHVQGLEDLRCYGIPEAVAKRKEAGEAFLEKTELQSLMEWKMKHGTYGYRPSLAKLIDSNSPDEVRQITSSAFSIYNPTSLSDVHKAITLLIELRGVGPATASLILSCYDPVAVPFFSEDLYRWLYWHVKNDKSDGTKKRKKGSELTGWDRTMKYTAKEYRFLFEMASVLRERLNKASGKEIRAADVEKAAYDIAKRDMLDLLPSVEEASQDAAGSDSQKCITLPWDSPAQQRNLSPTREPSRKRRKRDT